MAVLTGKSDSLNLFLKLIDTTIKALSQLLKISKLAGCPYLCFLRCALDGMRSFKDKVLDDLDYEKLSPSA